ncbi:uncharacterized protein BP5553_04616 [Venustampulla echinocandica]|uniref:Uncharacterized protein n=1 Tax=Venustampulla echinocandica TaxID=2656787 RepID=A0A370TNT6_9HELO|nr:uncharacterized protein BP5553_04616 [Venustampulla echinocandica]RDL37183.1 hypothetical protein BP5553_04616 [Venustampulla echinocandica]
MAGRQRTFDLVPTTLRRTSLKPPMTSKAAKKAYLQAQNGPRISRAEQRRRDAEELERQRKEYEKERAAARAKAAREKKTAKANAERESRKKMGLPEPSKFVRASQPTISMFVKTGNKRTWQEMGSVAEDSDETVCEEGTKRNDEAQPSAKQRAVDCDSEDEFGDFPSLSQSDLFEKINSSMLSAGKNTRVPTPPNQADQLSNQHGNRNTSRMTPTKAPTASDKTNNQTVPSSGQYLEKTSSQKCRPQYSSRQCSQELPKQSWSQGDDEFLLNDLQFMADMASTQLLSEVAEATTRSDELPPVLSPQQISIPMVAESKLSSFPTGGRQSVNSPICQISPKVPTTGCLHEGRLVSAPPPTRCLENTSANCQEGRIHKLLLPPRSVLQGHSASLPPPLTTRTDRTVTTQKSGLPKFPSRRPVLQERSINVPPPRATKAIYIAHSPNMPRAIPRNRGSCQNSTEMNSITPPQVPPSGTQAFLQNNFDDFYPSPSQQIRELMEDIDDLPSNTQIAKELTPCKPALTDPFMDLFSTQDFALSPEDLTEITTPGHASCHRGKQEAPPPPHGKPRFFEEKDDDLLHAALHESKALAAAAAEKIHKFQPPVKEPAGGAGRARRTLRRVQSAASDYGDDEFRGCSQELLALC